MVLLRDLPPALLGPRLVLVDHLLVLVVLRLVLPALLLAWVARGVVLLKRDSVVCVRALAVTLPVSLVVDDSKVVLQLVLQPTATLVLQPLATVGPVTRTMGTAATDTAARADTAMPLLPLPALLLVTPPVTRVMATAILAATTLRPTGEVPTGAFWSATNTE